MSSLKAFSSRSRRRRTRRISRSDKRPHYTPTRRKTVPPRRSGGLLWHEETQPDLEEQLVADVARDLLAQAQVEGEARGDEAQPGGHILIARGPVVDVA